MENSVEILIVEDSAVQAEKLKYFIEKQGYHVSVAVDGVEAISYLKKHKPSLVISDIIMPKMGGYELCQWIREEENLNGLPVVLLTTLSDPTDVLEALKCGADNFITKPYSERFLIARIKHVLLNHELQKDRTSKEEIEIFFLDKKHLITSSHARILNLLLSIYENAIQKNQELERANEDLGKAELEVKTLNEQLEKRVRERTTELTKEISDRKGAEKELEKHREHLEGMVRERTEKLQTVVNAMAGRELRMVELIEGIQKLHEQIESAGMTPIADDPLKEMGKVTSEVI